MRGVSMEEDEVAEAKGRSLHGKGVLTVLAACPHCPATS